MPETPDAPDARGPRAMAPGWRLARALGVAVTLAALGFVIGLAAVALHEWWWGLILAAVATLITAYALRPGWLTRLPYAAGWVVPVVLAMVPRPEGDYAVGGDGHGYSLVGIGMVLIVLTTSTLPLGRRAPQAAASAERPRPPESHEPPRPVDAAGSRAEPDAACASDDVEDPAT